jgi:predicted transposase YbfD/YdcC
VDALNCQKNIAKEISEADADYVLALKGNQGTAHAEVQSFLEDARHHNFTGVAHDFVETVDKEHGRVEMRRYWISDQIQWFANRGQWEKLRTVGMVEAERHVSGHVSVERRFYLCSLPPEARLLAHAVRSHWGIENQLHGVLDVQMGEDLCRVRTGTAATHTPNSASKPNNSRLRGTTPTSNPSLRVMRTPWV